MRGIAVTAFLLFTSAAFAQSWPAKMQGEYQGRRGGDKTYLELVKMDGDKVFLKFFVASAFCDHGVVDAVGEKKGDGWEINAPGTRCASWLIKLKPVDGKQKFEGTFEASSGNYGSVYYEWDAK